MNIKLLTKALTLCKKIMVKYPAIDVLASYHLTIKGGVCTVAASNLDNTIKVSYPEEGAIDVLLPPEFPAYLKGLTTLTLSLEGKTLTLDMGGSVSKMETTPVDDFPNLPDTTKPVFAGRLTGLHDMVNYCGKLEKWYTQEWGSSVILEQKNGQLRVWATNGHIVKRTKLNLTVSLPEDFCRIIPANVCKTIPEDITLTENGYYGCFTFQDKELTVSHTFRYGKGTVLDLDSVIPVDRPDYFTLNKTQLLPLLSQAKAAANKTTRAVKIILKDKATLTTQDMDFVREFSADITSEYNTHTEIGFNVDFLETVLKSADTDAVKFFYNTKRDIHPCVHETNSTLLLIMNVLLS